MRYSRLHPSRYTLRGSKSTWRPWSLRAPYLISFTTLCILLCIAIEFIIRGCASHGCHVFGSASTSHISHRTSLAYSLVPTAVSLALGLLWAVPHHDIMRLEPYFQMSVEGGARAADCLFLRYSYTFALFIPFKAWKSRHYVVLLSSCILLLMNFMVTPLISGIFDERILEGQVPANGTRRALYPDEKTSNTTVGFSYMAYSYNWLGRSLPPFTTPGYTLLPVADTGKIGLDNETWSAETILFEAELACEEAGMTVYRAQWDDTGTLGPQEWPLMDMFVGSISTTDDWGPLAEFCDYLLPVTNCSYQVTFLTPWSSIVSMIGDEPSDSPPPSGTGSYIIAWALRNNTMDNETDITDLRRSPDKSVALHCTSYFYSEPVTATFIASSGQVLGVNRTGVRSPFSATSGFHKAIYGDPSYMSPPSEYRDNLGNIIGLGFIPPEPPQMDSLLRSQFGPRRNYKYRYNLLGGGVVAKSPVFINDGDWVTAFALHNQTPGTLSQLLDPNTLERAYRRTFKLLFAFWVAAEMVDSSAVDLIPAMRQTRTKGFVVNGAWARSVQGGLAAVIVMSAVLGVLIPRRRCELDGEPNSLAEGLRLMSGSLRLCRQMENAEFHKPEAVFNIQNQGNRMYTLELVPRKGPRIRVRDLLDNKRLINTHEENPESHDKQAHAGLRLPHPGNTLPWLEQLWALRTINGIGIVMCFGIVLVLCISAFIYSRAHHGLPLVTEINSFGYKLLFSYIPLAISMTMEPLMITVGTAQCMLGPYNALSYGTASSSKSIATDYEKSPPQFQVLRALRKGNIPLAVLAFTVALSSLLTIAFSGMFSPTFVEFSIITDVVAPADLRINGTFSRPADEMYYILSAQLTGGIPALSWTTPDYYILPFVQGERNMTLCEGPTMGIGVDIACVLLPPNLTTIPCSTMRDLYYPQDSNPCGGAEDLLHYVVSINDSCWDIKQGGPPGATVPVWSFSLTPNSDDFIPSENCPGTFFAVWAQRNVDPQPGLDLDAYLDTFDATILKCTSRDIVTELTATITQVKQVNATSNVHLLDQKKIEGLYVNTSAAATLPATFIHAIVAARRKDSAMPYLALTWFNHLMVASQPSIVQNTTNLTQIPDPSHLAQTFEDIYRRLFAINLNLQAGDVLSVKEQRLTTSTALVKRTRVKMDISMLSISIAVLGLTVSVLVVFYLVQATQVPGHLPTTTLAGVYALLYASNAKQECGDLEGDTPEQRAEMLRELGGRYTYGPFTGGDGKKHFGVYRVDTEAIVNG